MRYPIFFGNIIMNNINSSQILAKGVAKFEATWPFDGTVQWYSWTLCKYIKTLNDLVVPTYRYRIQTIKICNLKDMYFVFAFVYSLWYNTISKMYKQACMLSVKWLDRESVNIDIQWRFNYSSSRNVC